MHGVTRTANPSRYTCDIHNHATTHLKHMGNDRLAAIECTADIQGICPLPKVFVDFQKWAPPHRRACGVQSEMQLSKVPNRLRHRSIYFRADCDITPRKCRFSADLDNLVCGPFSSLNVDIRRNYIGTLARVPM